MLAGNDLNLGEVRIGRHRKSVGHKAVRIGFQYALIILQGIACLQQIGDHYGLSVAHKGYIIEIAARKVDIFKRLGICK